jgi:hypothetical protein
MTNPTYKPAPTNIGFQEDRLARFTGKPQDMTEEQYASAKEIAVRVGAVMPQQMADSAFYFYYMGANWDEIANKLNIPIGMVLYTAVHYGWFEKKKLVNSVRAGEKVTRADAAAIDLVTDIVVATAALYKQQIAEVIKDPSQAKNCPLIPKSHKEFALLLQMLQSLQTKDVEGGAGKLNGTPNINVNIANLQGSGNEKPRAYVDTTVTPSLPAAEDENRLDILKVLERARNS